MNFDEAKNYVMTFGKYKDKSLDTIAKTDEGLKYLDWLHGERTSDYAVDRALKAYLSDPAIKKELESLVKFPHQERP